MVHSPNFLPKRWLRSTHRVAAALVAICLQGYKLHNAAAQPPQLPADGPLGAQPSATQPGVDPAAAGRLRLVRPTNGAQSAAPALRVQTTPVADPSVPSPQIQDLLGQNRPAASASTNSSAMPELKLKARIMGAGKPAVAIIEMGGKLLTVREGSDVMLNSAGGTLQLKVVEVSTSGILLESADKKLNLTLN